jgi:hypothetical protein
MKKNINYRKFLTLFSTIFLLTSATSFMTFSATPTPTDIENAIEKGIEWLASKQNPDGSWGTPNHIDAKTGFALIKLADYAYEEGYDSPFNESYQYSDNVTAGWDYLLENAINMTIPLQTAGDPDENGNGFGIYWHNNALTSYCAGICLMALVATGTPNRVATGYDFDEDGSDDTFFDIAQDVADWLAFAQTDPASNARGGWNYQASHNLSSRSDNSITGYATLGLAAAESSAALQNATPFECNIPSFVITELDYWTLYIQSPDGGSGYTAPGSSNMYRTGNLIFEMTMMGYGIGDTNFDKAIDYIEANWANPVAHTGWNISGIADYQAMFTLMKGFVYSGITTINLTGIGGDANHDWFMEFATVLLDQQNPDGSWPSSNWDDGQKILSTCWALLVLEKISPEQPPSILSVSKDFRHTNVAFSPCREFYLEDFESDCPPTGWMIYDSPSDLNGDIWACNNTPNITSNCDPGGVSGTFMEFDDDDYGSSSDNPSESLVSPSIDCSMYKNIYLDFDGDFEDMAGGGKFWVNISTNGGSTWTEVFFETEDVDPGGWDNHTNLPISLSPYADMESNLMINFTYSDVFDSSGASSWGWGVSLDNIRLTGEYPAELGDLIEYNKTEDLYYMDLIVKQKGKKNEQVSSTNPGQLYAVINMSGPINNVTVNDHFDYEFDVNPAKVGGGVEIILVDPDGYSTIITKDPGVTAEVDNENNWVNISIELDEQLQSGWNLMIYIKFQTAMKHKKVRAPFNYDFNNTAYVYLNDIDKENDPTIVTADILLTPKR